MAGPSAQDAAALQKIQKVGLTVEGIRRRYDSTFDQADRVRILDLEKVTDPRRKVRQLQTACMGQTEDLLRQLMELDSIETAGNEELRNARRAQVKLIQELMDQVDRLGHRLQQLHSELPETLRSAEDLRSTEAMQTEKSPAPASPADHEEPEKNQAKTKVDQGDQGTDNSPATSAMEVEQPVSPPLEPADTKPTPAGTAHTAATTTAAAAQPAAPSSQGRWPQASRRPAAASPPAGFHARPHFHHRDPQHSSPTGDGAAGTGNPYARSVPHGEPVRVQTRQGMTSVPKVDVHETDDAYLVRASLPGLQKDDVSVDLLKDQLTISGRRRLGVPERAQAPAAFADADDEEEDDATMMMRQDAFGRLRAPPMVPPQRRRGVPDGLDAPFHRSFQVPPDVDQSRISADLANGVLEVRLPKKHRANRHFIPIA